MTISPLHLIVISEDSSGGMVITIPSELSTKMLWTVGDILTSSNTLDSVLLSKVERSVQVEHVGVYNRRRFTEGSDTTSRKEEMIRLGYPRITQSSQYGISIAIEMHKAVTECIRLHGFDSLIRNDNTVFFTDGNVLLTYASFFPGMESERNCTSAPGLENIKLENEKIWNWLSKSQDAGY
jgi:hypothetical protein